MTLYARTGRLSLLVVAFAIAACGGGNGDERTPAGETVDADTVLQDTVAVIDSLISGPDGETSAGDQGGSDEDAAGAGNAGAVRNGEAAAGGADRDGETAATDPPRDGVDGLPPSPSEREEAQRVLPGRYQLGSVEGESLPVIIGEGPECNLQLANGELTIRESLDFLLRATTQHVCGGERVSQDVHTAEGQILPDGGTLRFNARYDSLFATAHGLRQDDGAIVINRLDTEGGPQEVNWRFLR